MTLVVEIGPRLLRLEHLVLDVNGTLTRRGVLIDGVAGRLERLAERLAISLLTADTFGALDALSTALDMPATRIATGSDKARVVRGLGRERCVAIGNGTNDVQMLAAAVLSIAVVGPEGASGQAVMTADIICGSITDALDLLIDPRAIVASLRP